MRRFSLVAEIGWLASQRFRSNFQETAMFQSRCRDWVVGEEEVLGLVSPLMGAFQSRCRDWVVGECEVVEFLILAA